MSTLLIDIGNSRIKWALLGNTRLGRQQALPLAQFARFERALARMRGVMEVHAVCVAGRAIEARLRAALRRHGLPAVKFARSSAAAAGVTNSYREPWRLGADRWVGAIGAWYLADARRAVCVVSVGTALTIDVVDAQGCHRGGLIAPGTDLMIGALLDRTHGIAVRATRGSGRRTLRSGATPPLPPLATDTRAAIYRGALLACAGLVDTSLRQVRKTLGSRPAVSLTGGGAGVLAPLLQTRADVVPELVLCGLAVLSHEH